MYFVRVLLVVLLWPCHLVFGQELLLLTFTSEQPGDNKTYSTIPTQTISVAQGHQVTLQKSRGKDYRLTSSAYNWSRLGLEQTTTETTFILVTPQRQGEKLSLEVNYVDENQGDKLSYRSTVTGEIGQWIPLLQQGFGAPEQGSKRYTSGAPLSQLWVKADTRN